MSKKKKKPIELQGRGDWGDIKPITKIIPNKKKNLKIKHKNRADLDNQPFYFFMYLEDVFPKKGRIGNVLL